MKAHLRLILDVVYELNGEPVEVLKEQLRQVASSSAGNGTMTGSTDALVESWECGVNTLPLPCDFDAKT